MRKIWLIMVLLVVAVLISGCTYAPNATQPTPGQPVQTQPVGTQPAVSSAVVQVDIKNYAFVPQAITVTTGTTVVWTNRDSVPHTVTSDTFDSGPINQGQTFTYTFNQAGTFEYRCTIHPSIPHGTVTVT